MRSFKEWMIEQPKAKAKVVVDDKTIFFLFQKIMREEYGSRGVAALLPVEFKEGILSVVAKSSLYSSELWLRRTEVIERLNREIGSVAVIDLKLARYAP